MTQLEIDIYTENDILIGTLTLTESVQVDPNSSSEAQLYLSPVPDMTIILLKYFAEQERRTFQLKGGMTLKSMTFTHEIRISEFIELNRSLFLGGQYG